MEPRCHGRDTYGVRDVRWRKENSLEDRVNLAEKLASFDEQWEPRIVAMLNDYRVIVVKVEGDFVWHKHDETDDLFLVLKGHLTIQLRDRDIELDEGSSSSFRAGSSIARALTARRGCW
jgi:mannose-6-phosphate isomerase-like protein (cupin superfamily)